MNNATDAKDNVCSSGDANKQKAVSNSSVSPANIYANTCGSIQMIDPEKSKDSVKKGEQFKGSMRDALSLPAKTFPEKLMYVLSQEDISDIIAWLPHGRSFIILEPQRFAEEVLPIYFKQAKYSSFTRKLYRWGFRHITKGADASSFYHELFRRDDKQSCMHMYCTYSDGVVRNRKAKMNGQPALSELKGGEAMQLSLPETKHQGQMQPLMPLSPCYHFPSFTQAPGADPNASQQFSCSVISNDLQQYQILAQQFHQQKMMASMNTNLSPQQAYITYLARTQEEESAVPKRPFSLYKHAA